MITSKITQYEGTVPLRTQDEAAFNTNVSALLTWWPVAVSTTNDVIDEINATAADINSDATGAANSAADADAYASIAMANANYKGQWATLTGALAIPASVEHAGKLWVLLSSLANVTLKEPGVDTEWKEIPLLAVGDVILSGNSAADMLARGFLPCDGSSYLQSAYPSLFASLGILPVLTAVLDGTPVLPANITCFGQDESYLYIGYTSSPYFEVYRKSDWEKITITASVPSAATVIDVDDNHVYIGCSTSPYFTVMKKSDWAAETVTAAPGTMKGIGHDATHVFLSCNTTPYFKAILKGTWNAFVASTPTLGAEQSGNFVVESDSTHVFFPHVNSPYLSRVRKSGWVLETAISGVGGSNKILQDDTYLYLIKTSAASLQVVNKATATLVPGTVALPASGMSIAQSDDHIFISHGSTPWLTVIAKTDLSEVISGGPAITADHSSIFVDDDIIYMSKQGAASPSFIAFYLGSWAPVDHIAEISGNIWGALADESLIFGTSTSPFVKIIEKYGYDTATEFATPVGDGLANGITMFIKAE